jgi:predicted pyridoxine 5'-phosphate oxidase superfamily flavin-nucleotide-binding protein
MSWKNVFEKGQELVLSTCSMNATPNVNVVISLGFYDDKLLIADAQMNTTIKNLEENNKICIFAKKKNLYYRLRGDVEIFNSGKFFDSCVANDEQYPAKNAILVSVYEVFDLDKGRRVV